MIETGEGVKLLSKVGIKIILLVMFLLKLGVMFKGIIRVLCIKIAFRRCVTV